MESTSTSFKFTPTYYEKLLRDNVGLLEMQIKMPVRDTKSLGLVYTPGVAANCLAIKNEKSKALRYTNKMNAVLVVTDSSGFPEMVEGQNWNNMAPIPYLEAICVYYKNVYNIDAYPLVLDMNKIKSEEELFETIDAIMTGYSAVEFFTMCPDRLAGFYNLTKKEHKSEYAYIDSSNKRKLDETLKSNNIKLSANSVYGSVLRAVLDAAMVGSINEALEDVTNQVLNKGANVTIDDVISYAAGYIVKNNLYDKNATEYNQDKLPYSVEYVLTRYHNFRLFGQWSWVEQFPNNYKHSENSNDENSLLLHARYRGIVGSGNRLMLREAEQLDSLFSWSNLDSICKILLENPEEASHLTCKKNLGAILTNGTAILGLGDIGAVGGLPVMEGKSVLFKLYGGNDIVPICIDEKNPDVFIRITERILPIFSIINLEDIKSPDCFQIEPALNAISDYPVFHDDQHGTAVVVLAGIINALKLRGTKLSDAKIVMNGAGAAGLSVAKLILHYGAKNFIICDTTGAIYTGRPKNMNGFKNKLAEITNVDKVDGKLSDVLKGADVFIGLSAPKALSQDMVRSMNAKPIVFALANPTPEIYPNEAIEAGAFIVATGRSDFPNQINNSLAFPGIFRAAVDVKAKNITIEMKVAASEAIASLIDGHHLGIESIMPGSLDTEVSKVVCQSVARVAIETNENKDKNMTPELILENINSWFQQEKLLNYDLIKEKNYEWKK